MVAHIFKPNNQEAVDNEFMSLRPDFQRKFLENSTPQRITLSLSLKKITGGEREMETIEKIAK